jgi:hypothetical protein
MICLGSVQLPCRKCGKSEQVNIYTDEFVALLTDPETGRKRLRASPAIIDAPHECQTPRLCLVCGTSWEADVAGCPECVYKS